MVYYLFFMLLFSLMLGPQAVMACFVFWCVIFFPFLFVAGIAETLDNSVSVLKDQDNSQFKK